jgi:hypothetical protein
VCRWRRAAEGASFAQLQAFRSVESWNSAASFANFLTPSAPGQTENLNVDGLDPGLFYSFSVRAVDEVGQMGQVAPSAFAQAKPENRAAPPASHRLAAAAGRNPSGQSAGSCLRVRDYTVASRCTVSG